MTLLSLSKRQPWSIFRFFHITEPDGPTAVADLANNSNPKLISNYLGFVLAELENLYKADPAKLTTHQTHVLQWFGDLVWANEISLYQAAKKKKISSIRTRARTRWTQIWRPLTISTRSMHPIADSRDGGPIRPATITAKSYFLAVGLKKLYGAAFEQISRGTADRKFRLRRKGLLSAVVVGTRLHTE